MNVWSIMKQWLYDEGYTFYERPRSMMPYKSWIQIDVDKIQLWTGTGGCAWIYFIDCMLEVDYFSEPENRCSHIDLRDPEAFDNLKKLLDSL